MLWVLAQIRPAPPPPPPVLPTWDPVAVVESLGVPHFWAEYVVVPAVLLALVLFVVLTAVAYLVYLERKVAAFIQARLGPMRVGPWGLLQPLADGLKLLAKEDLIPANADPLVFPIAPIIALVAAISVLAVIPFGAAWATATDVNIGLLLILATTSVGIFGIVLAGWSSNSKYPLLGALRSSAQLISYEVAIGLALLGPLMFARSLSMQGIIDAQRFSGVWYVFFQPQAFVIYMVCALAETNRAPFDLPESESEIVAGYHVEYSGFRWAIFFMAEYTNMIITAAIATTVFLGGWWVPGFETAVGWIAGAPTGPDANPALYSVAFTLLSVGVFAAKTGAILYAYMWIRWTLPRYRYDQLMDLGWKWLIPASLVNIVLTGVFFVIGMKPSQGGVLGVMESTENGIWMRWVGFSYFVVAGIATVAVTWLLLAVVNRNTHDFNLHAQRQLQIRRRAERLAALEERKAGAVD